jgi:hypothetical protein
MKTFDEYINEDLKPGYNGAELKAMLKPIMNQVYEATFTEEAKKNGIDDRDEQVMGHILSKYFNWDAESILKAAAYGMEDANQRGDYDTLMKMAGGK